MRASCRSAIGGGSLGFAVRRLRRLEPPAITAEYLHALRLRNSLDFLAIAFRAPVDEDDAPSRLRAAERVPPIQVARDIFSRDPPGCRRQHSRGEFPCRGPRTQPARGFLPRPVEHRYERAGHRRNVGLLRQVPLPNRAQQRPMREHQQLPPHPELTDTVRPIGARNLQRDQVLPRTGRENSHPDVDQLRIDQLSVQPSLDSRERVRPQTNTASMCQYNPGCPVGRHRPSTVCRYRPAPMTFRSAPRPLHLMPAGLGPRTGHSGATAVHPADAIPEQRLSDVPRFTRSGSSHRHPAVSCPGFRTADMVDAGIDCGSRTFAVGGTRPGRSRCGPDGRGRMVLYAVRCADR